MRSKFFIENTKEFECKIDESFTHILNVIEGDNNRDWSKAIYQSLSKIHLQNSKIACSLLDYDTKDCTEWLFDYVEYEEDEFSNLKNIILVAECEWNFFRKENYFSDLKFDFEKLLVAKSDYRLFVFESDTREYVIEIIEKLKLGIQAFDKIQKGDRFLFSGWIKSKEFYFDLYIA